MVTQIPTNISPVVPTNAKHRLSCSRTWLGFANGTERMSLFCLSPLARLQVATGESSTTLPAPIVLPVSNRYEVRVRLPQRRCACTHREGVGPPRVSRICTRPMTAGATTWQAGLFAQNSLGKSCEGRVRAPGVWKREGRREGGVKSSSAWLFSCFPRQDEETFSLRYLFRTIFEEVLGV